jgi:hypothetical protein
MGSNQSKYHSLVQSQALAKWHLARTESKCTSGNVRQVPVQSLRSVCATSDKDFAEDVRAKIQRGWTPWCAEHGIQSAKSVRRAVVVATGFGALFVFHNDWQEMKRAFGDTDEEWAIRVMWTLEDEIDHPWHILRTFVLRRSCTSKSHLVHAMTQEFLKAKRLFRTQMCWRCHKAKLSSCTLWTCSLCGIAKYCSKACQGKDWFHHKQTCAELQQQAQRQEEEEKHALDCIDQALANPQAAFW